MITEHAQRKGPFRDDVRLSKVQLEDVGMLSLLRHRLNRVQTKARRRMLLVDFPFSTTQKVIGTIECETSLRIAAGALPYVR